MQVSSLALGESFLRTKEPQRDFNLKGINPIEKSPPLLGEQKFSPEQMEASLRGSKPSAPDLEQSASDLEKIGLAFNRRLKFVIDHDSREVTIKVIDNETDKVIKVLPPEELQRLHSKVQETVGFLFDRMV